MSLLTDSQLSAVRKLGELGMRTSVTIRSVNAYAADDANPFGDDDLEVAGAYQDTTVNGWLLSNMGREFEEDGGRIVAIHDYTLRVPVGTVIKERDLVFINSVQYTVVETNKEDSWAEWTECFIKRVA